MNDHRLSAYLSGRSLYDHGFPFHLSGRRVNDDRFFLHLPWRRVNDHGLGPGWRSMHDDSFRAGRRRVHDDCFPRRVDMAPRCVDDHSGRRMNHHRRWSTNYDHWFVNDDRTVNDHW
jgi:hypothetical protein